MNLQYLLNIDAFGNIIIDINLQINELTYNFQCKLRRQKHLTKNVDEIIKHLFNNDFSTLKFNNGNFSIYGSKINFGTNGLNIKLTQENKDIFIKFIEYIKPHICIDNEEELELYNEIIYYKENIDYSCSYLKNISNQTFELCKYSIDKHGFSSLNYIVNHTDELCYYIIDKNIVSITFVKNLTDEVKLYVINKAKDIINENEDKDKGKDKGKLLFTSNISNSTQIKLGKLYDVIKSLRHIEKMNNTSEINKLIDNYIKNAFNIIITLTKTL
jgi:hypothetical protein